MIPYVYKYQIGTCGLSLELLIQQSIEEKFQPFKTGEDVTVNIEFVEVGELPDIEEFDLVTEEDVLFSEYLIEGEYVRTFHGTGTNVPYAVLRSVGKREWECKYLKSYDYHFQTMDKCFRHIALERILMEQETAILHASFIEYRGQGILFTGPSGIGKSTQADLWEKYENAEILNGDRTILRKKDGIWYAYGSPYAGSSRIYKNKSVPVRAIVSLEKSPDENQCVRLKPGAAFGVLYSGMTLNTWNREFMETATKMIQELCMEVPVFQMKCIPEQSAVICLKQELDKCRR